MDIYTRTTEDLAMRTFWEKEPLFFLFYGSILRAQNMISIAHAKKLRWYGHTTLCAINDQASFLLGRHWQQLSDMFQMRWQTDRTLMLGVASIRFGMRY